MKEAPQSKPPASELIMQSLVRALSWIGYWLLYVLLMMIGGAIVFGIAYPIFGSLLGLDLSLMEMFTHGLRNGAFLIGGVWGPGVAFIICIIRAHKQRERERRTDG